MTNREKYPDVYKDLDRVRNGPKPVYLTPDDILTLKLLRDEFRHAKFKEHGMGMDRARSSLQNDHALETLERILKQVG